MNDYAIEVHGLTKRFGERTALADLDLAVPGRSVFGFLGPNGAGKTTLIRLLLGLTSPTKARWLLGLPIPEARQSALARVGAIVEEPHFHRFLTGRENLRSPQPRAGWKRMLGSTSARRVGLSDRADDRVKSPLGMRQRLGVARALLADPGS